MRRLYRLLSPEKAWHRYGNGLNVEYFITDFFYEGYTDIREMCQKYISDVISNVDGLVTLEERAHVTKLFYRYIKNYIDSKGGINKLKLFSQTELDIVWNEEIAELLKDLKQLALNYQKENEVVLPQLPLRKLKEVPRH